jgi:uncharacterized protein YkwD
LAAAASLSTATLLALVGGSCSKVANSPASPTPSAGTSASATVSAPGLEQQTHAKINAYRTSSGLPALVWNDTIANVARQHSVNMAGGTVTFGHDGFGERVTAIGQTIPLTGAAENLAMASGLSDPASAVVTGWLGSASHKPHIDGDYNLTGIGVAIAANGSIYFTQIFVKPR